MTERCTNHVRTQRGWGQGIPPPPPEKSQNTGFLSNTGPDPLKSYKATKPAFNVVPTSACQRNDGPLIVVFGSILPSSTKKKKEKNVVKVGPPSGKTFWIRACPLNHIICLYTALKGFMQLEPETGYQPRNSYTFVLSKQWLNKQIVHISCLTIPK